MCDGYTRITEQQARYMKDYEGDMSVRSIFKGHIRDYRDI